MRKKKSVVLVLLALVAMGSVLVARHADAQDSQIPYCKSFRVSSLRTADYPFFCKSQTGVIFERLEMLDLGIGWMDLDTGLFWRDQVVDQDYAHAEKYCQGKEGYLPTAQQFETAVRHGLEEVLPMRAGQFFWLDSSDLKRTDKARVFTGNKAQGYSIVLRSVLKPTPVRCVLQNDLN